MQLILEIVPKKMPSIENFLHKVFSKTGLYGWTLATNDDRVWILAYPPQITVVDAAPPYATLRRA